MAKSKWPQVQSRLVLIEKWARDGLTEKQIAKNLGISKSTLETYKKEHPDLLNSLKVGKEPFIAEIENSLAKRAKGYDYEEVKTYIKVDPDGNETRYQERTSKHVPASVAACNIILKNKAKEDWCDNPRKSDLDRKLLEWRKEQEGMKNF